MSLLFLYVSLLFLYVSLVVPTGLLFKRRRHMWGVPSGQPRARWFNRSYQLEEFEEDALEVSSSESLGGFIFGPLGTFSAWFR